jgi:hypothetical protein
MNLDNKKLFINNLKIKIDLLINESLEQFPINLNHIKNIINDHNIFINFTDSMKIYENYKWAQIKEDYNKIKKKINSDKKLYTKIVKIFGIINNYYSSEEFNIKNNLISKLYNYNNLLILEWIKIKELHNNLINKNKGYIKNKSLIKIYIKNDDILELIKKLYEIYYGLKKLEKKI